MPARLSAAAKAVWRRIVPPLAERGVLTDLDVDALVLLCVLRAEFEKDPVAFTSARLGQLRQLLADFGLSPATRARVPVLPAAPVQSTKPAGVTSIEDVRQRLEQRMAEEGGK